VYRARQDAAMTTTPYPLSRVFRSRYAGSQCDACKESLEPGTPMAYIDDEAGVGAPAHARCHPDPRVRAEGDRLAAEPEPYLARTHMPSVFRARRLGECPACQDTLEPGELAAYDADGRVLHAAHHDDPRVRAQARTGR
jgi:hypothetical protein